jgi:hypothetical protein
MVKLQTIVALHVVRSNRNMGSEDARLWEDAMGSLRDENTRLKEMNTELRQQNLSLKDFIKHLGMEVSSFLNYNSITKEL